MKVHLNPRSGIPIYVQLVTQIKHLVASGRLATGAELPAIRVLAEQLLINPNTVGRAYRELENAGILVSRRGSGTYVSDEGTPLARKERIKILCEHIDVLLAEGAQLNVSFDEMVELMRKRREVMRLEGGVSHD